MICLGLAPSSRSFPLLLGLLLSTAFVLGGCGSEEDRITDFMTRGDSYVENDEYPEAIIEFRNVLQIDPNHAAAHEALSTSYLEVGKVREAYWEMSETVRLDPTNIPARLRYGTISSAAGEHELARDQADAVLAIEPNRSQAYVLRAHALEGLEDLEGAEADLLKAIDNSKDSPAYQFLYAGFLERYDRIDEAIAVMRELVDLEPSYIAVSGLGRLLAGRGSDPAEAEAVLRRAVEVSLTTPKESVKRDISNPEDIKSLVPNIIYQDAVPGAAMLLAAFFFEGDRFDESIATLEEAVGRADGQTQLIYQMARLYAARGMTEKADALIVRATEEAPDDPGPQLILSAYLGQQGDLTAALEAAMKAVEIDPENKTAQLREAELRVDIAYRDKDLEEVARGRKIVEAVLESDPSNPEAHFVRAKIALAEEDVETAEQSLLTALEARPDWPQARFVLGSTLAATGEIRRARVELARTIELDPAMAEARRMLMQIHAELGEHEFAIEQGRAYLRQKPNDNPIRIVLGQSLIRVGRAEEAYEELSKMPEDSRRAAAHFALGRLDIAFGRKELGKERLLKANEMKPGVAEVLRILLALDREEGQMAASSKRIREAVEANPADSELAELAAEVAAIEGDVAKAKEAFEWAVELDARNVSAQLALADIERRSGNSEGMLSVMEKAAEARPESSDLQYRLGLAYEQGGKQDAAAAAYERAIGLDANLAQAKNNLAYLLAERPGGDLDRALELAQQAKEQRPDDPNAADTLGWVLLKRGVPSAAIGYLEEAYERFPTKAVELRGIVGNHLAEAYEKNKESAKAITQSQAVIASYQQLAEGAKAQGNEIEEPEWARDARVRIDRLGSSVSQTRGELGEIPGRPPRATPSLSGLTPQIAATSVKSCNECADRKAGGGRAPGGERCPPTSIARACWQARRRNS